jgi:hypothetical protein
MAEKREQTADRKRTRLAQIKMKRKQMLKVTTINHNNFEFDYTNYI